MLSVVPRPISVRAPSKVNLHLAVGDLRPDGYHELTTVFQALSLSDQVDLVPAPTLTVRVRGEGARDVPTDRRNLVWKAATRLAHKAGREPLVEISIDKGIPVAGGMAGGSADAAAALLGLNALWQMDLTRDELAELALELGSDVPFALHGGTALGTGRGEELATVLARNTFHWVLAFSATGLSTPKVFGEIDRLRAAGDRTLPPRLESPEPVLAALASGDPAELAPLRENALADHPWREWAEAHSDTDGKMPGGQSRWSGGKDLSWQALRTELVAEVRYEHVQSGRFRHGGRLVRFRPDRQPESCTYAQLDEVAPAELATIFDEQEKA